MNIDELPFTDPLADTSEYIYHYTSADTLLKYILPQKRLRFSPLSRTNDPEEKKWHITCATGNPEDNWANGRIFDITNTISKGIAANTRIICFSQDTCPDDGFMGGLYFNKGFAKPRMWAQYAQNHSGVCLAFKRDKVVEVFNKTYADIVHYAKDVNYEPLFSILSKYTYAHQLMPNEIYLPVNDVIADRVEKYHEVYYFSKHRDWMTENEFRLLIKPSEDAEAYLDIDGLLEYIIMGENTEDCLRSPIELLMANFSTQPELRRFGYNRSTYTFY